MPRKEIQKKSSLLPNRGCKIFIFQKKNIGQFFFLYKKQGGGGEGGLAKDQTFYRFFWTPSLSLKCPERLAGNRNVAWRRKSAPECRLRRGWKRKRPRLGDNNHNTLSFGIQFQLSSKHIFASNAHEKHLNGLTLATTSPKPMTTF